MNIKYYAIVIMVLLLCCQKVSDTSQFQTITTKNTDLRQVAISKSPLLDSTKLGLNFKPRGDYNAILAQVNTDRRFFKQLYRTQSTKAIDSASKYVYHKLLNDIVPHWYHTEWDFNGYTNRPNEGKIACGYFVSTTLKHLGFNLNRYKMAQQAGLIEAMLLQPRSELKTFSGLSFETLKSKVNAVYGNGLYFVGLDNHVGYVLIKDSELYFLHSSYCDNQVVLEPAATAPCFKSNIYVFAEISTNKTLIRKWLLQEHLPIPGH